MNILWLMILFTIFLVLIFVVVFIVAARAGQFDDLVTPAHKAIMDDELDKENN